LAGAYSAPGLTSRTRSAARRTVLPSA
jgi:hypothetical protein